MSALFDLSGKTALITGASKGMGLSMATALAEHGANVVISSRKQNELDEAAAKINDDIGRNCAIGIASNIGDKTMVKDLVAQTKDKVGPINVLVGNAGVNVHYGSTHEIPDEAYEKIMSANVQSQLWLAREAHGQMVVQGGGSMMFTSSVGAFHASDAIGTYCVSKLALMGVIRNLATEYGPQGIRVNGINPAVIKTDFAKALWDNPKAAKQEARIPLGRFGEPDDLKGLAVFLGSDASRYITGQAHTVCGGSCMWSGG